MVAADRAMAPYLIDLEATETMAKKIPCSIRTNILSCAVWERASHVALLTEAEVWVGMKSHSDRLGLNYSWKSKRLGSPFTAAQRRHQVSIAFLGNDFSENSGNSIVRGPNISTVVLDRKGGVKAYHFSFP